MKTKTVYPAQPAANFNEWREYVHAEAKIINHTSHAPLPTRCIDGGSRWYGFTNTLLKLK